MRCREISFLKEKKRQASHQLNNSSFFGSVETFSDGQISDPTRAQYRTVPLRPHNVTFAPQSIGPTSFSVRWSGPIGISEFDRYQVRTGGHSAV